MTQPTVFIVDDDEFVRDSLAALLLAKGMEAVPFASAEAFLLGYRPVASGCAIIDMRMPGMDGLTLLEHLGWSSACSWPAVSAVKGATPGLSRSAAAREYSSASALRTTSSARELASREVGPRRAR